MLPLAAVATHASSGPCTSAPAKMCPLATAAVHTSCKPYSSAPAKMFPLAVAAAHASCGPYTSAPAKMFPYPAAAAHASCGSYTSAPAKMFPLAAAAAHASCGPYTSAPAKMFPAKTNILLITTQDEGIHVIALLDIQPECISISAVVHLTCEYNFCSPTSSFTPPSHVQHLPIYNQNKPVLNYSF